MIDGEVVLQERLQGKPTRVIARELGCTIDAVNEVLDQLSEEITVQFKVRSIAIQLGRLEALTAIWYEKALAGDPVACALVVKISERLASLVGLDANRVDVIQLRAAASPTPSGTEKILRVLEQFRLTNGSGESTPGENTPPQ
jgi:hypothetical protein